MTAPALSIRDVCKTYRGADHVEVRALSQCSIEVAPDEFLAVVGPSGCGKTTLLNIVAGFDDLTQGEVLLDGAVVASPGAPAKPGPERMVVFQHGGLFPWMTALENVCYGPVTQRQMRRQDAERLAIDLMARVGLHDVRDLYPADMSSGMRRRVEIVRAIIAQPRILLMDEPFRALDALTKVVVQNFLVQLHDAAPHTTFFITHDLTEAIFLADKVAVMTTRPGHVKRLLTVPLARPRDNTMFETAEFLQLKREVTELVHAEAVAAFEMGEREAAR